MLGGLGQPGAPRRGWRGGDRSQRVAQAPEWVDESQPKGRRKKGGVGRGVGQTDRVLSMACSSKGFCPFDRWGD